jgi:serine phosphatase RsbU (regulator of sigma subunit)
MYKIYIMIANENNCISILIVEDDPIQARLVSLSMQADGFYSDTAYSGELAISKISSKPPNIIILDLNLPDMNGLQFMDKLKKVFHNEMIKIIIYSSEDTNEMVLEALSKGATDYAFKKDDPAILKARVSNVAKSILLNRKLNQTISEMEENLYFAREIQLSTIPKPEAIDNELLDFSISYLPADYVSGDIYDIYQYSENKFRVFLADAPGHGIQAGFITVSIKTEYDRLKKIHKDISEIMRELNEAIFNSFNRLTVYTCVIMEIDLENQTLSYTNSGHPTQLLIQNDALIELNTTNPIIGFLKNLRVKKETIHLASDFRLFLFSDGIFEFFDKNNDMFGSERFHELVWSLRHSSLENLYYDIMADLYEIINNKGFDDDITTIAISPKKNSPDL